jgi:hypothetical protein
MAALISSLLDAPAEADDLKSCRAPRPRPRPGCWWSWQGDGVVDRRPAHPAGAPKLAQPLGHGMRLSPAPGGHGRVRQSLRTALHDASVDRRRLGESQGPATNATHSSSNSCSSALASSGVRLTHSIIAKRGSGLWGLPQKTSLRKDSGKRTAVGACSYLAVVTDMFCTRGLIELQRLHALNAVASCSRRRRSYYFTVPPMLGAGTGSTALSFSSGVQLMVV